MTADADRRCPDCDARMERVEPVTSVDGEVLRFRTDEPESGLLGSLGINRRVPAVGYCCPDCGLVRLYADLNGD